MASPSIQNFDISFIERTLKNLEEYKGEYDFTLLLNSLLGLLILPNEFNIKGVREYNFNFLEEKITKYTDLKDIFFIKDITLINEDNKEYIQKKFYWSNNNKNKLNPEDIKLADLINRIRNGVAHFGIIPTKDGDKWKGIIIRNYPEKKSGYFNMEIYFEEKELKTFAEFIAKKYLKTIKVE